MGGVMLENKINTTEDTMRFLDVLEAEYETAFTGLMEQMQEIEQKIREVDYTLQELDQKPDSNMNFFSPVGVYEEGEEKRELLSVAESLKEELPRLAEKLEQYKHRREQIQILRRTFLEKQERVVEQTPAERSIMDRKQGLYILESHEFERNRIARDLHDSSVQSLTGLVHKTELCMRLADIDTVRVKLELQTMSETIKTIINGMREIIYNLRPMSLDNLGLAVTIDAYCLQLKKTYDMEVVFQKPENEPELPSIWKVTLYRILQEACRNVVKHANASRMDITISYEDEKLKMAVKDNGKGFDITRCTEASNELVHNFGVSMMKERVKLLGGTIQIQSVIGVGTTVSVEIPLQEKEETRG